VIGELNDPLEPNDALGLLDVVRGWPAVGEPGEVYAYADTNYVLMSLVIDELTGDSLDAIRTDIIEPLKLESTTFYRRDVAEPPCICNTYWETGADRLENVSDLSREYATQVTGADGLAASPLDALTFVEAIVRGDLLSEDARAQMTDWSEPSIDDEGYGYGLGLARVIPDTGEQHGHTGGGVGTGAVMRASPDQEVTFVAATNVGMFLGGPLADVFDEDMWDQFAEAAGIGPAP
jgi:D-alanyl-D-alanine carboxypeptidase